MSARPGEKPTVFYKGFQRPHQPLEKGKDGDKEALRKAIADTDMDTIVGHIKYNKENYSRTPLVGGQWVKEKKFPWDLRIVYNKEHPNIPLPGKCFRLSKESRPVPSS